MKPNSTVAAHLKRCRIPRRDFLQFCTQLMVAAPWGLAITEKATAAVCCDRFYPPARCDRETVFIDILNCFPAPSLIARAAK